MHLYANAGVYRHGQIKRLTLAVDHGRIVRVSRDLADISHSDTDRVFDLTGFLLTPGFVDAHVHLREPGFFHKETMKTGTMAAARGGYTAVCAMPNVSPAPDGRAGLQASLDAIARDASVRVYPYGTLTVGRKGAGFPAPYAEMSAEVVGFSDDGCGVQDEALMRACMRGVGAVGGIVVAHCEDESLLHGGVIHAGAYARAHRHAGIVSQSEWGQVARDLRLAEEVGCAYHVCHVSTKESVQLIREAKARGVNVTCETAPHYLLLTQDDLEEDGRFKMNPPLREAADRAALLEGLLDGAIDMIATDHAPHTAQEKARGLDGSAMGVVGLECAFGVLNEGLVQTGKLSLEKLLALLCDGARARFHLPGGIEEGEVADFNLIDLNARYVVDPAEFASMGRATPFAGCAARGRVRATVVAGKIVYGGI
ncbi:MAG: dihydroorotase [Clostridia bacterium]